jgi:hypothetical protein
MKRLLPALLAILLGSTLAHGDLLDGSPASSQSRYLAGVAAQGGWRIANLTAANDSGSATTQMDLSADYVVFYNPVTGKSIAKRPPIGGGQLVSNLGCNISSAGPVAGGRDISGAFVATNTVWWYLISGPAGISCETSLTGPTTLNSANLTGPVLPAGYDSYAPAFPIKLVGSATLTPTAPQGGSTSYYVEGNTVSFTTWPYVNTGVGPPSGFPTGAISIGTWVPVSVALMTNFWSDIEAGSSTATVIGGAVITINGNNVLNCSLYVPVVDIPAVCGNNGTFSYHLPSSGNVTLSYCAPSGSPLGPCAGNSFNQQVVGIVAPTSYTFSNGN